MAITTRHALAGCHCVWHDTQCDLTVHTWLKSTQAYFKWSDVEPTEGNYNWTLFDNRILNRLEGQGDTYVYLQINAKWPSWIFNYIAQGNFLNDRGDNPPQFWDQDYIDIYEGFIAALASHINAASYKDQVWMVRAQANAYNPESINPSGHWSYTHYIPTASGHRVNTNYSHTTGDDYAKAIIQKYYTEFNSLGILICGKTFGSEWGYDISDYIVDTIGAHVFQTNETPNSLYREHMLRQCKTRKEARGFSEPNNWSGHWLPSVPRVQVMWWSALTALHQGIEWVSFYESDAVSTAFSDVFDFVNKYAGYLYAPADSPGAWIAFTGVSTRYWKDLGGCREFLISILNESSHSSLYNYSASQFDNSALNPYDVSTTNLGPTSQKEGVWALAIATDPIQLDLDSTFVGSLTGNITLRVTFRNDSSSGHVYVKYEDGDGNEVTITHNMASQAQWVTRETVVTSYRFTGGLTGGADILIDSDVAAKIHMLEVIKEGEAPAVYKNDADLEALWLFEEAGTRHDDTDNDNDLGDNNTVARTTTHKEGSYAADFERGNSEYLNIADASQTGLDITGNLSIVGWIRPESIGNALMMIAKYNTSNNNRSYQIQIQADGTVRGLLSSNGTAYVDAVGGTTLQAATWYHVAMVYNGTDIRMYLDGSLDTNGADNPQTYSSGIYSSSAQVCVGSRSNVGNYYDGIIDELAIFSRALSADEVASIYQSGIQDVLDRAARIFSAEGIHSRSVVG